MNKKSINHAIITMTLSLQVSCGDSKSERSDPVEENTQTSAQLEQANRSKPNELVIKLEPQIQTVSLEEEETPIPPIRVTMENQPPGTKLGLVSSTCFGLESSLDGELTGSLHRVLNIYGSCFYKVGLFSADGKLLDHCEPVEGQIIFD